jgi:hypothetical protein
MKKLFKDYFTKGNIAIMTLMIVCAIFGVMDGSALAATATATDFQGSTMPGIPDEVPNNTTGLDAGLQSPGNTLTDELVRNESDQILLSAYDKVITQFRPYLNPLDTLLRYVEQRPWDGDPSLEIKWGANDVKAVSTYLSSAYVQNTALAAADIVVANAQLFATSQTIKVIGGVNEVDTLTVSGAATVAGQVLITLNGVEQAVSVLATSTAINIADLIRATAFTNYTTGGPIGTTSVTFTATQPGVTSAPTFAANGTGAAASFAVKTAGSTVIGYLADGATADTRPLTLYVQARNYGTNTLTVVAINGPKTLSTDVSTYVPSLPAGVSLYRLGRAAAELDITTDAYNAIPTFVGNYMQSFKSQVTVSNWFKKSKKNVKWDKVDIEDAAKFEYKREIEASSIYGVKGNTRDTVKNADVLTCNGISSYITQVFEYQIQNVSKVGGWDKNDLILFHEQLFSENVGSNKRIVFAGKSLLSSISMIDYTQFKDLERDTKVMFGIEWDTIKTIFGTTYWVHMPLMDEMGEATEGYAIDPQYLYKYSFEQQNVKNLDLVTSGIANADASVTTEVMCPALAYPKCHMKIHLNPIVLNT